MRKAVGREGAAAGRYRQSDVAEVLSLQREAKRYI